MARPREFDEGRVLDAAVQCFWARGYDATTVRDLVAETGLAAASLYNAFGDKRALYRRALDRYVEESIAGRMRRCERLPPRRAIEAFFAEILARSLDERVAPGCMLVNAAIEAAPHDTALRGIVADILGVIEAFFRSRIEAGQAEGTIAQARSAEALGRHLLGALMGLRVLARVRPERALLQDVVASALSVLDGTPHTSPPREPGLA